MNYDRLLSANLPRPVSIPEGLMAPTKYVFSVTYADRDAFPLDGLASAISSAMAREGLDLTPYPPVQGHVAMREYIARNLARKRALDVDVESIFLSSGAGGAITTILDVFIDPGDIVLVEEFSYLGTLGMLLGRGVDVRHIPTDGDGMDTDALEGVLSDLRARGRAPKLIYTISVYQNPMGMTLSLPRRRRMVEIAQAYGVLIVENESYADFRIEGDPLPPSMMGMDDEGSVIYVSAYTKLLGCGLRLGYAVIPDGLKDTFRRLRFGIRPSHLAGMAVHEYLRTRGDEYIAEVAASLRKKRDSMLAALGEHFPPACSWNTPEGGMMVWVRLPEGADTWSALPRAVEADVKYNPGGVFRADRSGNNYLRLTYSHNSPEEIAEGIEVLAGVFEREGLFGV